MSSTARPRSEPPLLLLAASVVGLLVFAISFAGSPQRAWADLLLGGFYLAGLSLFGTVFVALTYVFSSGWAVVFRRVPEAMSAALPIGAVLMLALFFGRTELYPWARPEVVAQHPLLQHKAAYLNVPSFFLRMAVTFAIWIGFSSLLRRHSRRQDLDGDPVHSRRNQTLSAGFLVLCVITFVFSSFDWIMSLQPEWYSTIFPVYLFSGLFLGGTAAMTVLVIRLCERGHLPGVSEPHRDALGRMLVAAGGFWAFVGFSQYMLIYYTNIPSEAIYYAQRLEHGGRIVWMLSAGLSWLVPMALLIPARRRRSSGCLLAACTMVLVGRWLDLYLLIMPSLGQPLSPQLADVGLLLALVSLFVLPFLASFHSAEPLPRRDPYLGESLAMHG